jgi:hypothetical protein
VRTPSQELTRIADALRVVAERLRAAEDGAVMYTKADVDRIVEARLVRERKRTRPRPGP